MSNKKAEKKIVENTNTFLKDLSPSYDAKVYILACALNVRGTLNEKVPINKCKGYVEKCLSH